MKSTHIPLIHEMLDLGQAQDIPIWLESGWAIDARRDRITRQHEDQELHRRFSAWRRAEQQPATNPRGRPPVAAGGTLFLDEVAELPLASQAKLLRVLQEHEFQRVGGTTTLRADVRFITATNRDLARAVEEGTFRQDLYYRLNVFSVHLPPLRERAEDILRLAEHFVGALAPKLGKGNGGLSRDAQNALLSYRWPGNIRGLANAVERALILADGSLLTAAHFDLAGSTSVGQDRADGRTAEKSAPQALADLERGAILAALERTKGNKTRTAAILGITRTQLQTRLKRFGIAQPPAA